METALTSPVFSPSTRIRRSFALLNKVGWWSCLECVCVKSRSTVVSIDVMPRGPVQNHDMGLLLELLLTQLHGSSIYTAVWYRVLYYTDQNLERGNI